MTDSPTVLACQKTLRTAKALLTSDSRVWQVEEFEDLSVKFYKLNVSFDESFKYEEDTLSFGTALGLFTQRVAQAHILRPTIITLEKIKSLMNPVFDFGRVVGGTLNGIFPRFDEGENILAMFQIYFSAFANVTRSVLVLVYILYEGGAPLVNTDHRTFITHISNILVHPFVEFYLKSTEPEMAARLPPYLGPRWDEPELSLPRIISTAIITLLDAAPSVKVATEVFRLHHLLEPRRFANDEEYVVMLQLLSDVMDAAFRAVAHWEARLAPGKALPAEFLRGLLALTIRYHEAALAVRSDYPISLTQLAHVDTFARITCSPISRDVLAAAAAVLQTLEQSLCKTVAATAFREALDPLKTTVATFIASTLEKLESQHQNRAKRRTSDMYIGCSRLTCILMGDAFIDNEDCKEILCTPAVIRALFTPGFTDGWHSFTVMNVFREYLSFTKYMGRVGECIANGELEWVDYPLFKEHNAFAIHLQLLTMTIYIYAAISNQSLCAADSPWPHAMPVTFGWVFAALTKHRATITEGHLNDLKHFVDLYLMLFDYDGWPKEAATKEFVGALQRRLLSWPSNCRDFDPVKRELEWGVISGVQDIVVRLLLSQPDVALASEPHIESLIPCLDQEQTRLQDQGPAMHTFDSPLWGHVEYLQQLTMDAMLRSCNHVERLERAIVATWKRLPTIWFANESFADHEFCCLAVSLLLDRINDYAQIVPLPADAEECFSRVRKAMTLFINDPLEKERVKTVAAVVIARLDELKLGLMDV